MLVPATVAAVYAGVGVIFSRDARVITPITYRAKQFKWQPAWRWLPRFVTMKSR